MASCGDKRPLCPYTVPERSMPILATAGGIRVPSLPRKDRGQMRPFDQGTIFLAFQRSQDYFQGTFSGSTLVIAIFLAGRH